MVIFPNIDPVALSLGPLKIHWYGIMYLLGFLLAGISLNLRGPNQIESFSKDNVWDLIFYLVVAVIVGGRLGYVLFYGGTTYLHEPLRIFAVWEGGMSFHGGGHRCNSLVLHLR